MRAFPPRKTRHVGVIFLLFLPVILQLASVRPHHAAGEEGFIQDSGVAVSFSGFGPSYTDDARPDAWVNVTVVNASGTEQLSARVEYSRGNPDEMQAFASFNDDFTNSSNGQVWNRINENQGIFTRYNGGFSIQDLASEKWLNIEGYHPVLGAPGVYQEVEGNVVLETKLNVSKIGNGGEGGLFYKAGDEFLLVTYRVLGPTLATILVEDSRSVIHEWSLAPSPLLSLRFERDGVQGLKAGWFTQDNGSWNFQEFSRNLPGGEFIGVYCTGGDKVIIENWTISPAVWLQEFSPAEYGIKATGVPFDQFDADNLIRFVLNVDGESFTSNWFNVTINCSEGPFRFILFSPNDTEDLTPDCRIYGPLEDTGILGLDEKVILYSGEFAYSRDGSKPTRFINPHSDDFLYNSTTQAPALPYSWHARDFANATHVASTLTSVLEIRDVANSRWDEGLRNAPALTQTLFGPFQATARVVLSNDTSDDGGILIIFNDTRSIKLLMTRVDESSVNLSLTEITPGASRLVNGTLVNLPRNDSIWLRVARDDSAGLFTYYYSFTGDSYNFFHPLGSIKVDPEDTFETGIFVEQNGTLSLDYWEITPSIGYGLDYFNERKYYIEVHDVPFNQYSTTKNYIRFGITDINYTRSKSNAFLVRIVPPNDKTMKIVYSDQESIQVVNYAGQVLETIPYPDALDVEYLPSGNFMVAAGTPGTGSIVELDVNGTVVREFTGAGGVPFSWPHDADLLPNGHVLIADTGNDRVVELDENGTITWQWNAWDVFDKVNATDGISHLNDVDRLPNGNTLVSLRNLDTIVELDPDGNVAWEYGRLNGDSLNHPHNPDRLSNGTTVICDSVGRRIIGVDANGSLAWEFKPMKDGAPLLGWPRDADVLPDGTLLVSDSQVGLEGKDAIYLFDLDSGEVINVWESGAPVYDADVFLDELPPVTIFQPVNATLYSEIVEIQIDGNARFADVYYNIKDLGTGDWVFPAPIHHQDLEQQQLMDGHSYLLVAWSNFSGGTGGGYPQDDSVQVHGMVNETVQFTINMSALPPSGVSFPGITVLTSDEPPELYEVDELNRTTWKYELPVGDRAKLIYSSPVSVDMMPSGNYLVSYNLVYLNGTMISLVMEVPRLGSTVPNIVYKETTELDESFGIHDADYLPETDTFLIADTRNERVIEVNRSGGIAWSWYPESHYDMEPIYGPDYHYHLNDADRLSNGNTLVSLNTPSTVVEVDPAGNVVWEFGELNGSTELLYQHNPTRLTNGNTMICDSKHDRVIEVSPDGDIVWSTENITGLTLSWPRGAEKLPNGNILISDSSNNRHVEVTPGGKIVWEFKGAIAAYDADRLDRLPPSIWFKGVGNETYEPGIFNLGVDVHAADLASSRIRMENAWTGEVLLDVVFPGPSFRKNITLEPGVYILKAWSNDTYMNTIMDTSDQWWNIAHEVLVFTVRVPLNVPAVVLVVSLAIGLAGVVFFLLYRVRRRRLQEKRPSIAMKVEGDDQDGTGGRKGLMLEFE